MDGVLHPNQTLKFEVDDMQASWESFFSTLTRISGVTWLQSTKVKKGWCD